MEAEEIDELNKDFSSLKAGKLDQCQLLKKYFKVEIPEKIEDIEYIEELFKALMMRIENGDYDHFWQLITNNDSNLIYLMRFSSKTDDIKFLISDSKNLGLDQFLLKDLIIATHEPDYIERCIEDKENLELDSETIFDLILATGDIEKYIGEDAEYGKKHDLDTYDVTALILKTGDTEFIKKCIENRELYQFSSKQIEDLIVATGDIEKYIGEDAKYGQKYGIDKLSIMSIIRKVENENLLKTCIENWKRYDLDTYDVKELILATGNIEKYIGKEANYGKDYGLEPDDIKELILATKNTKFIKECIENRNQYGFSLDDVKELILETGDIEKYIGEDAEHGKKYDLKLDDVKELILATGDIEKYIGKETNYGEGYGLKLDDVKELILATGNIEKYIGKEDNYGKDHGLKPDDIKELILATKNTEFIKECIENGDQYGFSPDDVKELILGTGDLDYIAKYICKEIEEPEDKIKVMLENMLKVNAELLEHIDINIFKTKYIEILGEDKINQISCYPEVQEQILRLDEKQLCIFGKCIDRYMQKYETEEWTPLASSILQNIGQFDELLSNINDIEDLTEEDIEKLSIALQNGNFFEIKDINQLRDFDRIRKEKCEKIISNGNASLEQKKEALLFKMFGHGTCYAETIIRKYGEDIESIEDCDVKYYVKALIEINKISDPELIKNIFVNCEHVNINTVAIERGLKSQYWKQYNEILYSLNKQDKLTDKETSSKLGISVEQFEKMPEIYLLSGKSEFNILMTSVGAFSVTDPTEDYRESWNMPIISTQHFCASYIREDMLGTAPIRSICYGFEPMMEDALVASGACDVYSSKKKMVSVASHDEVYHSPDEQINHTLLYNEMDIRRIQCGRKLQPSYIVVFKGIGYYNNMQVALRASEDWGGMPIVVIDVDSCLEIQKKKVKSMIDDYDENPTIEQARAIIQKVRNNTVTDGYFYYDFIEKLTELESKIQEEEITQENQGEDERIQENQGDGEELQVSEENMRKFYDETSAIERKKEMGTIKKIYDKIKNIVKESEKDD